jgi:hypothetical protein
VVKVLDLFAGGGGSARGYLDAGFDQVTGVDTSAGVAPDFIRGTGGSFLNLDALAVLSDRKWKGFVQEFDLIHASPPCFPGETPVLTQRGLVPIENIVTGDLVLTHRQNWRPVTAVTQQVASVVRANWMVTTPDHPFLAYRRTTHGTLYDPSEGLLARGHRPHSTAPAWVRADELHNLCLGTPSYIPPVPYELPAEFTPGRTFWESIGYWVGNGWATTGDVHVAVGRHRVADIRAILQDAFTDLSWKESEQRTAIRFSIYRKSLAAWLRSNFGRYAYGKTFPAWLFSISEQDRRAFLAGYLLADGNYCYRETSKITTISPMLAVGLRILASTLNMSSSIHYHIPTRTCMIEGRTVSEAPSYQILLSKQERYGTAKDGFRWTKQRQVFHPDGNRVVYDLTVEEDHSFIAWGYAVHNCQGYSHMSLCRPGLSWRYPKLIGPVLELLRRTGVPFVIENVANAETRALLPGAALLCGVMFGRPMYRHRLLYAEGFALPAPAYPWAEGSRKKEECGWPHPVPAARAGHWEPGFYVCAAGHERRAVVNEAMQITWMKDRENVTEAVPPAYTRYAGRQFLHARASSGNSRTDVLSES